MKTYELWDDIPNGVTVYVPFHNLLAIKLESATLVAITEHEGKAGWMQTTGRLQGPFEDVFGRLNRSPRQWRALDEVPADVSRVQDRVGDKWKRTGGAWHFKSDGEWFRVGDVRLYDGFNPFTEIVK